MWAGLEYSLGVYAGFFRPLSGQFCYESGSQYVDLPGTSGNFISTPDSPAVSITGDLDIRIKVAMDDWTPAVLARVVNKFIEGGDQRSYMLRVTTGGNLQLVWSVDGIAAIQKSSTVATGLSDGTVKWVRVTLDVDNGAAGNDVKFYTSDDGVTWVQLGATVTTAGVTSIFDSTSVLHLGAPGGSENLAGNVYYAEVRNGIDGPIVASFNADSATITGPQTPNTVGGGGGETWTINGSGWAWGESTEICVNQGANQFEPSPVSNVEELCIVWCTQN